MAEEPQPLTDAMLDGTERIRVGRRMRDADGNRTGPVKVWTTAVADIIRFARRVSPTIKAVALSPQNRLTVTTTDGTTTDLGLVAGSAILAGNGAPTSDTGRPGDLYLDAVTGDFYRKEA